MADKVVKVTEFLDKLNNLPVIETAVEDKTLKITGDKLAETLVEVGAVENTNAVKTIENAVAAYRSTVAKNIFDETATAFGKGCESMTANVSDFGGVIKGSAENTVVKGMAGNVSYETVPVSIKHKAATIPGYNKAKTEFVKSIINAD